MKLKCLPSCLLVFHFKPFSCLGFVCRLVLNLVSRFWMMPLAWLVHFSCPESYLILDTLEGRVKSCKVKRGNLRNSLDSTIWHCWCFVVFNLIRIIASIKTLQRRVLWVSSVCMGAAVFSFITSKSVVFYLVGQALASVLLGEKEGGNGE